MKGGKIRGRVQTRRVLETQRHNSDSEGDEDILLNHPALIVAQQQQQQQQKQQESPAARVSTQQKNNRTPQSQEQIVAKQSLVIQSQNDDDESLLQPQHHQLRDTGQMRWIPDTVEEMDEPLMESQPVASTSAAAAAGVRRSRQEEGETSTRSNNTGATSSQQIRYNFSQVDNSASARDVYKNLKTQLNDASTELPFVVAFAADPSIRATVIRALRPVLRERTHRSGNNSSSSSSSKKQQSKKKKGGRSNDGGGDDDANDSVVVAGHHISIAFTFSMRADDDNEEEEDIDAADRVEIFHGVSALLHKMRELWRKKCIARRKQFICEKEPKFRHLLLLRRDDRVDDDVGLQIQQLHDLATNPAPRLPAGSATSDARSLLVRCGSVIMTLSSAVSSLALATGSSVDGVGHDGMEQMEDGQQRSAEEGSIASLPVVAAPQPAVLQLPFPVFDSRQDNFPTNSADDDPFGGNVSAATFRNPVTKSAWLVGVQKKTQQKVAKGNKSSSKNNDDQEDIDDDDDDGDDSEQRWCFEFALPSKNISAPDDVNAPLTSDSSSSKARRKLLLELPKSQKITASKLAATWTQSANSKSDDDGSASSCSSSDSDDDVGKKGKKKAKDKKKRKNRFDPNLIGVSTRLVFGEFQGLPRVVSLRKLAERGVLDSFLASPPDANQPLAKSMPRAKRGSAASNKNKAKAEPTQTAKKQQQQQQAKADSRVLQYAPFSKQSLSLTLRKKRSNNKKKTK